MQAAPAMYAYYQRTQTANDLLVAAPSGAGYTSPEIGRARCSTLSRAPGN